MFMEKKGNINHWTGLCLHSARSIATKGEIVNRKFLAMLPFMIVVQTGAVSEGWRSTRRVGVSTVNFIFPMTVQPYPAAFKRYA